MARLTDRLKDQFEQSDKLEAEIKKNLAGLGYEHLDWSSKTHHLAIFVEFRAGSRKIKKGRIAPFIESSGKYPFGSKVSDMNLDGNENLKSSVLQIPNWIY